MNECYETDVGQIYRNGCETACRRVLSLEKPGWRIDGTNMNLQADSDVDGASYFY